MKTKIELIKEAYGDHFEACKPDENGWTRAFLVSPFSLEIPKGEYECKGQDVMIRWRPISLKGLEDNNGWTSVKEYGLPKDQGDYWVIELGKAHTFRFNPNRKESVSAWTKRFTHWKPLDSRLPLHL